MSTRLRKVAVGAAAVGLVVVPLGVGAGYALDTSVASSASASAPAAVGASPSGPVAADGEFPQLTPAVARQLDDAVRKVMSEARIPGVMVSLSAPGKGDYVRAFGVADKATGRAISTDMNMRIGSVTKTFTVTALLQLVDQGKVGLDDPIGKYVSGVPNGDRITLRELAGMRSGLFNYSEDEGFFKALTSNPRRPFTPQELLAYSFKHPVLFEPNAKFYYCNTNLILLGLVVEKQSGQKLDAYINQKVVRPAGLRHTLFPVGAEFPTPHSQGYTDQTATGKVEDAADWNPSWGWAAGAMISDLADLKTWARVLATGTLLKPATQAERLNVVEALPGTGYGLGIFNVQGWIGHNGSLPGYQALVVYLPQAKATLALTLNTDISYEGSEPSTLFGEAITKIVTPDHVFSLPAQPVTGH
ncbi:MULTISPECIES: serine hydrolase domain-containing protein [unclassified Streptomyces]|uniref:serine hydrolase domain-containing protein n=1 Tax=unclassified Streptomyces TaxID=2593676 RepID=UPI002252B29E|nr:MULTISPECIES: serine hydrolase domain-containing protein [unclassified Streptomyces]MCX5146321.1 beta-lactamase family protein [Streptomyces sp. NBC_00320]WSN49535.1 serine hydrolase domain-containing protein [Streptomyces sp. NBC_01296]WSW61063.1 beta-lactamase family protein [Streptomyces sp. NBC_00998]